MAGIDKIYGTRADYIEFEEWCQHHCKAALKYFYPMPPDDGDPYCITNFPEYIDRRMWRFCPLDFVRDRIKEQYGDSRPKWKPYTGSRSAGA
jgi:hypothetical protein